MKKHISILAAVLALLSCQKNEVPDADMVEAQFSVATALQSKAVVDSDGKGTAVNRFVMEVWHNYAGTSELYTRVVNTGADVTAGTSEQNPAKTRFKVSLVKGQQYDVLFWADSAEGSADRYYTTDSAEGLRAVSVKNSASFYSGNLDQRDAFCAVRRILSDADSGVFTETVLLHRPFAQLNVITDDIDQIEANTGTQKVVPDRIQLSFKAPSKFSVLTGVASQEVEYTYSAAPYYLGHKTAAAQADKYTLTMDYILAPASEQAVCTVSMVAKKGENILNSQNFENIPLKRNWRTNILGSLLTLSGEFRVEVSALFSTPDYEVSSN